MKKLVSTLAVVATLVLVGAALPAAATPVPTTARGAVPVVTAAKAPGKVYTVSKGDGRAKFVLTPVGWGVGIAGSVTINNNDKDCALLKIRIDVVDGNDSEGDFRACGDHAVKQFNTMIKSAGKPASRLRSMSYQLCSGGWRLACGAKHKLDVAALPSTGKANYELALKYMQMPLADFLEAKKVKENGNVLNWEDDGCSAPWLANKTVLDARYYNLLPDACLRHDFGYRNLGANSSESKRMKVTQAAKQLVDDRFIDDLRAMCSKQNHGRDLAAGERAPGKKGCDVAAKAYYGGVHIGGGPSFFGQHFTEVQKIGTDAYANLVGSVKRYASGMTVLSAGVAGSYLYPSGKITIYEHGKKLSSKRYLGFKRTNFSYAPKSAGRHTLTVKYSGDSLHKSDKGTVTINVPKASSKVSVTGPDRVKTTSTADFTIKITGRGKKPTGTVTVLWGGGSKTMKLKDGKGTVHLPKLARGAYELTFTYPGDGDHKAAAISRALIVTAPKPPKPAEHDEKWCESLGGHWQSEGWCFAEGAA